MNTEKLRAEHRGLWQRYTGGVATLGSLMLIASCAGTTDPAALSEAAPNELAAEEVIVCEDVVTTGTRFPKRVCWSESVREDQRREADRFTGQIRRNSTLGDPVGGPLGAPTPAGGL